MEKIESPPLVLVKPKTVSTIFRMVSWSSRRDADGVGGHGFEDRHTITDLRHEKKHNGGFGVCKVDYADIGSPIGVVETGKIGHHRHRTTRGHELSTGEGRRQQSKNGEQNNASHPHLLGTV